MSDVCAVMLCSVIPSQEKCRAKRSARAVWSHNGCAGQIVRQNNLHMTEKVKNVSSFPHQIV